MAVLVCFSDKSNYALQAFSLGCPDTASIEIEVGDKQKTKATLP
jgi:hypothetical protein